MDPGVVIAAGQVSAKALSLIWKYYSGVMAAKKEVRYLVNELKSLQEVMRRLSELLQKPITDSKIPITTSLKTAVTQSLLDIKALEDKLVPRTSAKGKKRLGRRALKWPFTKQEVDEWVQKLQRLKAIVNLALNADQTSLLVDVDASVTQLRQDQDIIDQERQLSKLPVANDASFDSYHRQHEPRCVSDTRVELLRHLEDWGQRHQPPIFWLSGMAGTGKSTISRTLAASFRAQQTLGGSFFFSRGSGEANTAVNFVGTLVQQMASSTPQLKQYICEAISEHSGTLRQGLRNQWKELLVEPLQRLQLTNPPPMNLVIDALDECGSDQEIRVLLQLFVEIVDLKTIDLGIFVTSRPELPIRYGFKEMPQIMHYDLDLRAIPRATVEQDIRTFVKQELGSLSLWRDLYDWPSQDQISDLARKADCLFIYAATACRFIGDFDWDPSERLSNLLGSGTHNESATAQLDAMYTQILEHSLVNGRHAADVKNLCDRFKAVVGPIVLLFDELAASELAGLLSLPINFIELCLSSLHSVLDVPTASDCSIRLLHPSFHDYLISESRCHDKRFWVKQSLTHARLAERCLETISSRLVRNIGQLLTPGSSPQEVQPTRLAIHLPKHVQYACRYWVDHLIHTKPDTRTSIGFCDSGKVHAFFRKDFLHWFEAMSLLGQTPDVVRMITRLLPLLQSNEHPALYGLIHDARRFAIDKRGVIEQAPLQAYTSAIIFSPVESLVRKYHFHEVPPWLDRLPDIASDWGNYLQTLQGPEYSCQSIAFSPDGRYLASTANNIATINLWDTATGAHCNTLDVQDSLRIEVTFLPDGHLVSLSTSAVRLWDPLTGVLHRTLDFGIHKNVQHHPAICIQTNGDIIVWRPCAQAPQVWSPWQNSCKPFDFTDDPDRYVPRRPKSGIIARTYDTGRSDLMDDPDRYVPRRPESGIIACTYDTERSDSDTLIIIIYHWTEEVAYRLETDYEYNSGNPVHGITFAISSNSMVALTLPLRENEGIELHDVANKSRKKLSEHSDKVEILVFSANGDFLISGSEDRILRMWHVSSGSQTLIGVCSLDINFIEISPDGQQIAICGKPSAHIQLWELPVRNSSHNALEYLPEEYSEDVKQVCFSPGGEQAASIVWRQEEVQLHDTRTGALEHSLRGHTGPLRMVSYSPDGVTLATATFTGNITLWNPRTGTSNAKLDTGRSDPRVIESLVFSPDAKRLASCKGDKSLRIWDAKTGQKVYEVENDSRIYVITWSPDNKLAISSGENIRILDFPSGRSIADINTPRLEPFPTVFSPSGRLFAYWTEKGIMIYDLDNKRVLLKMDGTVRAHIQDGLAISQDDEYIAAAFSLYGGHVKVWDIKTGRQVEGIKHIGMPSHIHRMSFSPDGSYLETNQGCIPTGARPLDENRANNLWGRGEGGWIMEGDRKMLWLPPSFYSHFMDFYDGLFVVRGMDGKIRWLGLSQDRATTEMSSWTARRE